MDGPAVPIPPPLERDEIRLAHPSAFGPNLMAATNVSSELERSWPGALLASTNSEACAGSKPTRSPDHPISQRFRKQHNAFSVSTVLSALPPC